MGGFAANTIYGMKMYFIHLFSFWKKKKLKMWLFSNVLFKYLSILEKKKTSTFFPSSASPTHSWDKTGAGMPPRREKTNNLSLNLVGWFWGLSVSAVSGRAVS